MPDYLKEMRDAMAEGVLRIIARDALRRGLDQGAVGRLFGSDQPYGGGNGFATENHFTTGYDSGTGKTTVAFLTGYSPVDGSDIVTA